MMLLPIMSKVVRWGAAAAFRVSTKFGSSSPTVTGISVKTLRPESRARPKSRWQRGRRRLHFSPLVRSFWSHMVPCGAVNATCRCSAGMDSSAASVMFVVTSAPPVHATRAARAWDMLGSMAKGRSPRGSVSIPEPVSTRIPHSSCRSRPATKAAGVEDNSTSPAAEGWKGTESACDEIGGAPSPFLCGGACFDMFTSICWRKELL
mmetsp:Transcript_31797/g.49216  ORF Transcript_31797/g.49216 Transcript_31797/m.49216 type:complete len:206 (+) Transcript_31797:772-1389(+)